MEKLRKYLLIGVTSLTILAGAIYLGTPAVHAGSCCSTHPDKSGETHAEHTGAVKQSAPVDGISVDARVVSVSRADGKLSVVLDVPLQDKALAPLKKGDPVKLTLVTDKTGKLVVSAVPATVRAATFGITGIQCQACADRLQESLKRAPGVQSVSVTADPAQAVITYDLSKTSIDALKDAIRDTEPIHTGMPFGVKE